MLPVLLQLGDAYGFQFIAFLSFSFKKMCCIMCNFCILCCIKRANVILLMRRRGCDILIRFGMPVKILAGQYCEESFHGYCRSRVSPDNDYAQTPLVR